jgi:hypothetical protein
MNGKRGRGYSKTLIFASSVTRLISLNLKKVFFYLITPVEHPWDSWLVISEVFIKALSFLKGRPGPPNAPNFVCTKAS